MFNPLKNRSFNVKLVNDQLVGESIEDVQRDPVQGILVAQAYAAVAKDVVSSIAETIVISTVTIVTVKTLATVVNLGAKALFK